MVIIKRFGVFSTAKICGLLTALMFFIFGLAGMIMFAIMPKGALPPEMAFSAWELVKAWVIDTILFGAFGFLAGAIWAGFYNIVVGWIGGIDVELEEAVASKKPKKK